MSLSRDFPSRYFIRQDALDDALFYSVPRLVVHIDEGAIASLADRYREVLPPAGAYLDLMSSWRSHLPDSLQPSRVTGLGMNVAEMADNPQLDESVIHDLNRDPRLPFSDGQLDGVVCAVSVQYLTRPVDVFRGVNRVLKPGRPFVVSFSNRCFPQKAVAVWLSTNDGQHVELVRSYFTAAGNWTDLSTWDNRDEAGGPDGSDPLYVVWARRSTETVPDRT